MTEKFDPPKPFSQPSSNKKTSSEYPTKLIIEGEHFLGMFERHTLRGPKLQEKAKAIIKPILFKAGDVLINTEDAEVLFGIEEAGRLPQKARRAVERSLTKDADSRETTIARANYLQQILHLYDEGDASAAHLYLLLNLMHKFKNDKKLSHRTWAILESPPFKTRHYIDRLPIWIIHL